MDMHIWGREGTSSTPPIDASIHPQRGWTPLSTEGGQQEAWPIRSIISAPVCLSVCRLPRILSMDACVCGVRGCRCAGGSYARGRPLPRARGEGGLCVCVHGACVSSMDGWMQPCIPRHKTSTQVGRRPAMHPAPTHANNQQASHAHGCTHTDNTQKKQKNAIHTSRQTHVDVRMGVCVCARVRCNRWQARWLQLSNKDMDTGTLIHPSIHQQH
mmetsp:Transcript_41883/g.104565  ORF Transcript_41883/g.104565 Transcript_41883/m.104565 type:complete len:214 (-) Transcript_41883:785-1426(-)